MPEMITVKNLTKIFKVSIRQSLLKSIVKPKKREVVAVNNISFSVREGEMVAFLGANGAGKTTTLKMLTGILYPTSGSVSVLNSEPIKREKIFLKQIGLVMGNKRGLSWDLSPRQNYQLFRIMYKIDKKKCEQNISELAEVLEAQDFLDLPVRNLSLGQRMKAELIGAILHQPKILFLDEPTIGLDVVSQKRIRQFLRKINKKLNTTIILTSHNMEDIERVCKRVVVIDKGRLIYDNSLESLMTDYSNKKYLKVVFYKTPDLQKLKPYGKIIEKGELSVTLEVLKKEQGRVMAALTEKFKVDDLDITSVPLSEIIGDMFGK